MDYKATIFLPQTGFAMKGDLPKREPQMIERWRRMGLWQRLRETSRGRPKFILHDGPPYANGHLHIGHALNKILKDVINRSQQMLGKDANYVPGWDCHGLPIEWKIEEEYLAAGRDKDKVPIIEFRKECRDFAERWIDIQREEFVRLGVEGDWQNPYTTMTRAAEAQIAREIGKFVLSGDLYRGAKPVMWSTVEKTALAEAEIEYHDHTSSTIVVRFPVVSPSDPRLAGASVVIWTTTPWTMPGNRAIAAGPKMDYVLLEVKEAAEGSRLKVGERLVVAEALRESFLAEAKAARVEEVCRLAGAAIVGTVCSHPLQADGYEFPVPVYAADFVTTEQGTGFVHIAPGHGADDFELGQRHGLPTPETVADDGTFMPDVPRFAGKSVYTSRGKPGDANPAVIAALEERGTLIASGKLVHSYPHSWRSKAPLIFRATPQWFISMSHSDLRGKALAAIEATRWVPGSGRNRIFSMIEQRPDWCISRQRAWGVPITIFVDRRTREPLRDGAVNERIAEAFAAEGADCWFTSPPERFLGNAYRAEDFEQVMDIVDVWFESGSTHSFVLEQRADLEWPASLYLEGTDQHRGWFHSSLLESCGTRGRAPYDAVLTHGFTLDEQGRKMSKSLGNVVAPQEVVDKLGADILRLWVVASDYSEDVRVGPEVLKQQSEIYRRLRNTLRYILGALNGFAPAERLPVGEMEELERWVLHRLHELDRAMRQACNDFAFSSLFAELHAFCAVDLSAFYFDIRKDSLYCDRADSKRRRGCRTVLDELFQCLTAWLAPVLCFTAEEAWLARHPGDSESVHLRLFPSLPEAWRDEALGAKWRQIRDLRRVVTGALEIARADKTIGASLQAAPTVYATPEHLAALGGLDLAEIAITSGITLVEALPPDGAFTLADVPGVGVVVALADGSKCQRCWRVLPEVGHHAEHPTLCGRCVDAVAATPAAAE